MLSIKTKEISYNSIETSLDVTHCILIAQQEGKNILLSHPNMFLYKTTRASIKTSVAIRKHHFYVLSFPVNPGKR